MFGDSPSFLQVVGIIAAVIVGCAIFLVVILLLVAFCVVMCWAKASESNTTSTYTSRENRSRPNFSNLNPIPRRDVTERNQHRPNLVPCRDVNGTPTSSSFIATAPPLTSEHSTPNNETNSHIIISEVPPTDHTFNTDDPPSYAEAVFAMEKPKI